eukprot:3577049-Alexandrium_andersonii.AAC.1
MRVSVSVCHRGSERGAVCLGPQLRGSDASRISARNSAERASAKPQFKLIYRPQDSSDLRREVWFWGSGPP